VKTWSAEDGAWTVHTCHGAMSPAYTKEFGVEHAMRQAYYVHHEMVFPTLQDDDDRYFPRHRTEESGCRVASLRGERVPDWLRL